MSATSFDTTLARMYQRRGIDTLQAHLHRVLGITVMKVHQLNVGVFRVDRQNAAPVVVRVFSDGRAHSGALGTLPCSGNWSQLGSRPTPFRSQGGAPARRGTHSLPSLGSRSRARNGSLVER